MLIIYIRYQRDKIICSVPTLSAKDNQKISKRLNKGFESSVYWCEYKAKIDIKNETNEFRYFLESNFVAVNRLFVLVYTDEGNHAIRLNAQIYYLPKGIIKNYNVIINGKNFYDQPIDSNIKRYEEIRKLTTRQGEDYTAGCLLDYDYIRNHYRWIAVDLSRKKELEGGPKAIQQIEFVGQLKKLHAEDNATDTARNDKSMFVLTVLENIKEKRIITVL